MHDRELVKVFLDSLQRVEQTVARGEVESAKFQYSVLLHAYNELNKSSVDYVHKELAHDQLLKMHSLVSGLAEEQRSFPLSHALIAGTLVLLIAFVVVFHPNIVGLAVFPGVFVEEVNLTLNHSGFYNFSLRAMPTSLKVSGSVVGGGARISLVQGKNLITVFDSQNGSLQSFIDACVKSCSIEGFDNGKITLLVELDKSTLFLSRIKYDAKPLANNPPRWVGGKQEFVLVDSLLVLNASELFYEPDGESMVFLATTAEGLTVTVLNDIVRVQPNEPMNDKKKITLIASDLRDITKQQVTLIPAAI